MKKVFTLLAAILLTVSVFLPQQASAQTSEKMSYQAVIRNSSDVLVTNQQIGMQISILQGSATGTAVYTETQTPTTNANGLVSIEIGSESGFNTIDWANGPYFIKTETDPTGGTSYTISGTSQLLSVPYALHAKTSETVSGGITETDPVYLGSEAANITATDIANLGNLSGTNTGDQDISGIATNEQAIQDTASQIRADIPDVSGFLTSEADPIFGASVASGITATDITNWNNKLDSYTETDPVFAAWDKDYTDLTNKPTNATTTADGFMSSTDKIKLDGLTSSSHYLGEEYLDGIIFYLYIGSDGQQHGLIVSKTENWAKWQSHNITTNATRSWDGAYNMNLMSDSPAKDWVTNNFSTDWYLPSIDELSILWHNRFHVNKGLNDAGATLLSNNARYWSSTENNTTSAFLFFFESGYTTTNFKADSFSLRAVRAF